MKFDVLRENLSKGLSVVGRIVSPRSTLQVLSNVLLSVEEDGTLKLSSTNLELSVSCWVGAKVIKRGAYTVPAKTLTDLVGAMPRSGNDIISFELDNELNRLEVKCGGVKANIKGLDCFEFPRLISEEVAKDSIVSRISADTLRALINQSVFSCATDDTRPILQSAYTVISGKNIKIISTDGFRLTVREVDVGISMVGEGVDLTIPARAYNELMRIMPKNQGEVVVSKPKEMQAVVFTMDDVVLTSQLINGNYPDIDSVIKKDHNLDVELDVNELKNACRVSSVFARESNFKVLISTFNSEGYVTVESSSAEMGDNKVKIEATFRGEDDVQISFNVKYLIDVLNVVGSERVILHLKNGSEPCNMSAVGVDGFIHVLMPMQFSR